MDIQLFRQTTFNKCTLSRRICGYYYVIVFAVTKCVFTLKCNEYYAPLRSRMPVIDFTLDGAVIDVNFS